MDQLREATEPLASVDTQKLLGDTNSVPQTLHRKVSSGIAAFEILLHTPEEYTTRPLRLDFLQRAIAADVIVGTTAMNRDGDTRRLVIVREYVQRTVSHFGGMEQIVGAGVASVFLRDADLACRELMVIWLTC